MFGELTTVKGLEGLLKKQKHKVSSYKLRCRTETLLPEPFKGKRQQIEYKVCHKATEKARRCVTCNVCITLVNLTS